MKGYFFILLIFFTITGQAQNLVPNPGFENTSGCIGPQPNLDCLDFWKDYSDPLNPALNTADVCYNTAVFFPPSSIPAFEGTNYIGVDCQLINSEYVQTQLTMPMIAGTTYCVSFYVSVCDQTTDIAPSLGAYFSVNELTINPFTSGISAHVQGAVPANPAAWTKISGTYLAAGGEEFITLGGFQNNATTFSYMYIDLVEVYSLTIVDLGNDQSLCPGETLGLDAGTGGTAYLWSTGETSSFITVTMPGTFWVEKFTGDCSVTDTIELTPAGCDTAPVIPVPADSAEEGALYVPNSFSPNGDSNNDVFAAKGNNINNFEMTIYNRWGERVFYSANPDDGWNGDFRGVEAKEDIYVYVLNYQNGTAKKTVRGHVVLIR